ncbi:MAG: T9SS type A sorting domain-containing protein [Flavobacterium sp.]
MKKLYASLTILFAGFVANAQIVNIPDANFKAKLLAASPTIFIASTGEIDELGQVGFYTSIDTNNDGEIQLSEAQAIRYLDLRDSNISSLEGINSFTNLALLYIGSNHITDFILNPSANLKRLSTYDNPITTLDITIFPNLITLDCRFNHLTSLTMSGMNHLTEFICGANQLTTLDVSNMPALNGFECNDNFLTSLNTNGSTNITWMLVDDNQFTELDFSHLVNLIDLEVINCSQLTTLNIKNGKHIELELGGDPNLRYICTDDAEMEYVQWYLGYQGMTFCNVNTYCRFTPGGNIFTMNGNSRIDYNGNGCDANDLAYPNLKLAFTNGTDSGNIYSNMAGQYSLSLIPGTYSVTPVMENPSYFNVSPASIQLIFPGQVTPLAQDFCITPNGMHQDIEAWIVPLTPARPGFDSRYKIYYKNKGNVPVSGNITFSFEDDYIDFIAANPVQNDLSYNYLNWNYANLMPYEIREILVTFNINSPMETPAVNIGSLLKFGTLIYPNATDESPADNSNHLRQVVVGSLDPNDKTCVEGSTIDPTMIGDYVHYVIRFENTGTFAAENIVVKDVIDTAKFDIASLVPLDSSHQFATRILNGNQVEFIFENINLPFDDANNNGYIAFKIKTRPTLAEGDTFSNSASIYFDYNFPVITDPAVTAIQTLGVQDFDFNSAFSLSPVPVKNILNITNKQNLAISSVSIYNSLGQLMRIETDPNEILEVSSLKTGTYFIKIITDKGTATSKFIKQ